jgi:vacuolar iron transporter family protein
VSNFKHERMSEPQASDAGWHHVQPRIPDTPQRRRLERQRGVREIVFGAQDGILTTLGIITGVGAAAGNRFTVIISGMLALFAGALSMGVGEYLGRKSEREVVSAAIEMERGEMEADPQAEFAEQVAYYKLKGFTSEEAIAIVQRLTQNPEIYLYEMVRDEFGIDPREAENTGSRPAIFIAISYSLGSFVPILAFLLPIPAHWSIGTALVLAIAALFGVGYYAGTLAARSPLLKGLELVAYGCAIFTLSYLAGRFIPPLFGYAPVSAV